MTIKEAIRILEYGSWWDLFPDEENDADMNPLYAAIEFAIAALQEQKERENPKPLTLEELRQMDGEPVWMEDIHGNKCWGLVSVENDGDVYCIDNDTGEWESCFYCKDGWLAYRSKPKEDTHDKRR